MERAAPVTPGGFSNLEMVFCIFRQKIISFTHVSCLSGLGVLCPSRLSGGLLLLLGISEQFVKYGLDSGDPFRPPGVGAAEYQAGLRIPALGTVQ
jgi:hypothetical protein